MLLICELKKIWRPWLILIIGVLFYAYYVTNMRNEISFYNSYINPVYFKALAGRYGSSLEEDEVSEMRAELSAIQDEIDAYTAAYPPCIREGVTTQSEMIRLTPSFMGADAKITSQEWNELCRQLASAEGNGASLRWAAVYECLYAYDTFKESCGTREAFEDRLKEMYGIHSSVTGTGPDGISEAAGRFYRDENNFAIMNVGITFDTTRIFSHLLILCLIAELLLLLPPLVKQEDYPAPVGKQERAGGSFDTA